MRLVTTEEVRVVIDKRLGCDSVATLGFVYEYTYEYKQKPGFHNAEEKWRAKYYTPAYEAWYSYIKINHSGGDWTKDPKAVELWNKYKRMVPTLMDLFYYKDYAAYPDGGVLVWSPHNPDQNISPLYRGPEVIRVLGTPDEELEEYDPEWHGSREDYQRTIVDCRWSYDGDWEAEGSNLGYIEAFATKEELLVGVAEHFAAGLFFHANPDRYEGFIASKVQPIVDVIKAHARKHLRLVR
jgi:hypothetical protein